LSYMMHPIVVTAPASTSASHESFKLANLLVQSASSLSDYSLPRASRSPVGMPLYSPHNLTIAL
jgi:hypothetical protein